MGNTIWLNSVSPSEWVKMSNGLTDVFIDILELTQLSLNQKNPLIQWIIENHKNRIGDGFSGFDIGELPWNKDRFEEEREALICAISLMQDQAKWKVLNYEPNAEMILGRIKEFINLVSKMTVKDILVPV